MSDVISEIMCRDMERGRNREERLEAERDALRKALDLALAVLYGSNSDRDGAILMAEKALNRRAATSGVKS